MSVDTEVQNYILGMPGTDSLYGIAQGEFSPVTGQLLLRWSLLHLTDCSSFDPRIAEIADAALRHGASVEAEKERIIAYDMLQMLPGARWHTAKEALETLPHYNHIRKSALTVAQMQVDEDLGEEVAAQIYSQDSATQDQIYQHYIFARFEHMERYYVTIGQVVYQSLMAIKADEPPTDLSEKRLLNSIQQAMDHPGKTYLKSIPYRLSEELKEALKAL